MLDGACSGLENDIRGFFFCLVGFLVLFVWGFFLSEFIHMPDVSLHLPVLFHLALEEVLPPCPFRHCSHDCFPLQGNYLSKKQGQILNKLHEILPVTYSSNKKKNS